MKRKINQAHFKSVIDGSRSTIQIWGGGPAAPDIQVKISKDRVSITGSFELSEDLVFDSNSIFDKELFFDGGNYRNIIFIGGVFSKVTFRRGNYLGFVSIRGGNFQNLLLLGGNFQHWLGTLDGYVNSEDGESKLAEEELIIGRFEIEGGTYANNMWISGGKIGSLEVKCVTALKLHCKPNDDKIFDVATSTYQDRFNSAPKIKNLVISRYSNRDNFYHISLLTLNKIEFENFTNIGNITISKVKLEERLIVQNSDLGKTTFIDCDFSNQILDFESSKINEIALAGSLLPEPAKILNKDNKMAQKQLALSQIKKVYQNMGDALKANQYQSKELDTYMSTLNWNWEKINLELNSYSNRHGQSYERALGVLIVISILMFILYCHTLGFEPECSNEGVKIFFRNAGYILEFINPIRKSDFLPKALNPDFKDEASVPVLALVIDSISKLINAYLIYQLIAAFRKHGKKAD